MRRAPARPVRACFVWHWCTASKGRTWHSTLQTAVFTLHTSRLHFTLHAPHFMSSHLISAPLISFHLISSHIFHLSSSQLLNPSTAQSFSSHRSSSQLILALLHITRNFYTEKLLHTENFYTQRAFAHCKLLHKRNVFTQEVFKHKFQHTEHISTDKLFKQKILTQKSL